MAHYCGHALTRNVAGWRRRSVLGVCDLPKGLSSGTALSGNRGLAQSAALRLTDKTEIVRSRSLSKSLPPR
jgi:hypothetical protein